MRDIAPPKTFNEGIQILRDLQYCGLKGVGEWDLIVKETQELNPNSTPVGWYLSDYSNTTD